MFNEFHKENRTKDGFTHKCKTCRNAYSQNYIKNFPTGNEKDKKCSGCKKIKELNEFHKHKGRKGGVTDYCKNCRNSRIISKRYNLTELELKALFEKHESKCVICGVHKQNVNKGLAVDHCHKTGKIRGILCGNCNNGIGRFKDSIELLIKATEYLKENV